MLNGAQWPVAGFSSDLPNLIGALGERRFGTQLLAFLHKNCGAEHSAVFCLRSGRLIEVASASIDGTDTAHRQAHLYVNGEVWQRDPTMHEAQRRLKGESCALLRTDLQHLSDPHLRDDVYGRAGISDRVLICAKLDQGIVGLSILRSADCGVFSAGEMAHMEAFSESLLALLAKHISLTWDGPDMSVALTSLDEIEHCISSEFAIMPRREAEVCSRVIYGISTLGISLELGISTETVMTYRKRAYSRLGIATQRELLLWYLSIWSRWHGRAAQRFALQ